MDFFMVFFSLLFLVVVALYWTDKPYALARDKQVESVGSAAISAKQLYSCQIC